ncbi:MAG TPA: PPK2 family polyphosphate kinase [Flavisolibacter sp.]|jgi:PPK2 family polyphosphate:nucleotide phosphotransferase|nr:PPK2 family polyphosphate kinase [Flavisolibacter sp.]
MAILKDTSARAPKELDKQETKQRTQELKATLDELQNRLYAEGKHSVLVVIQGMDASGKDGAIKNVFGGLNPQGIAVKSFKTPTAEELAHDFLWRIHQHMPARGMIQLFNRSHYEDVLITRVHGWCDDETAAKRFKAINYFEQLVTENNNTVVLKFYLHVSPEEQQGRLQERVENAAKGWKYNAADFEEAKLWDEYMKMYEDVFQNCNWLPWTIVPADQNWYKEYLITKTVTEALQALNMQYPPIKEAKQ